jgi:hypothetical protein
LKTASQEKSLKSPDSKKVVFNNHARRQYTFFFKL